MNQSSELRAWGKQLRALRVAKGLTQMDICKATDAAPAAVYRWEAGKVRPQARFVRKLRELFPELPSPAGDAERSDSDAA
jgi:transcriptional regulator with XRE-family HTH domain